MGLIDLFERGSLLCKAKCKALDITEQGPESPHSEQCNGVEHIFRLYMEQNEIPPLSYSSVPKGPC